LFLNLGNRGPLGRQIVLVMVTQPCGLGLGMTALWASCFAPNALRTRNLSAKGAPFLSPAQRAGSMSPMNPLRPNGARFPVLDEF
jgi:hypothetical protein